MPYGSSPSPPLDPSLWHGPLSSVPYGSCPSLSLPNLLGTTPNSSAMGAGHSLKPHSVPCRGFGQQPLIFVVRLRLFEIEIGGDRYLLIECATS